MYIVIQVICLYVLWITVNHHKHNVRIIIQLYASTDPNIPYMSANEIICSCIAGVYTFAGIDEICSSLLELYECVLIYG